MYVCVVEYLNVCMYSRTYVRMCVCSMYVFVYVFKYVLMYVCVYVCMYGCMYVSIVYLGTHVRI